MTGNELLKMLKQHGWVLDRINGSHPVLLHDVVTIPVPVHSKADLKAGTLHKILKEAGLK